MPVTGSLGYMYVFVWPSKKSNTNKKQKKWISGARDEQN